MAREVEYCPSTEWFAPDPRKEERESEKEPKIPKEGRHPMVNRTCMIMQPIGGRSKAVGQWKGKVCDVMDYNTYTGLATVWVQSANQRVQLPIDCLFPR